MESEGPSWGNTPFIVRALVVASAFSSILAVVSTIYISRDANRLQQGDNTIKLIAAYGSETVRMSRTALYEAARQEPVDPARRALRFVDVAPLRGALGFVATCYRDELCLRSTTLDYFCVDIIKFDNVFGTGAPQINRIVPDSADIAFNQLIADCRTRESKP